jgi:membrane associated rhomboid family serine protease
MLPLRDVIPTRTTPVVTVALIGITIAVFLVTLVVSAGTRGAWWLALGVTPAHSNSVTLVTSLFLHANWLQLANHMLALWIFGENVEDRLGHGRFLCLYLGAGVVAGLAGIWLDPGSLTPVVGAAGAVAGVIGAYLLLFPRALVLVLILAFFDLALVEILAPFVVFVWIVLEVVSLAWQLPGPAITHVEPAALLAGVGVGVLGGWLLRRPERLRVEWWSP